MRQAFDRDELAAVVADGRAFDWSTLATVEEARTLAALWQAVRARVPVELAGVRAPRARLARSVAALSLIAVGKTLVTAGVVVGASVPVDAMQVATLLSFGLVGAGLVFGGVRDPRARHLGVVLLTIGAVTSNPLLRQASAGWSPLPAAIPWLRSVAVESFLPAALWLFVRDFPAGAWSPRQARGLRRGLVLATLAGLLLSAANLALGAGADTATLQALDRNSSGTSYFWLAIFVLLAPALLMMLRRRRDAAPDERAKVTLFVSALGLALLPAVLVISLGNRASPVRPWLLAHYELTGTLLYAGLVMMPAITAYAVLAHRVVRVELVLQNSARYALARTTLALLTAGPLGLFAVYAFRRREMPIGALLTDATGARLLILAGVAAMLLLVRRPLLAAVDRALRRDHVSLATALEAFARRSTQGLGLGDLADALKDAVAASFHPEIVGLLVADGARQAFVGIGAAQRPLARTSVLSAAVTAAAEPVVVDLEEPDGVARLLPRDDQEWLADGAITVLVPLAASGGDVCALLALGRMASGRPYTEPDLRFLAAVAAAAAPTVEARLLRAPSAVRAGDVDWEDESGRECRSCGVVVGATVNRCVDCDEATVPMAVPARLLGKFTLQRRLGAGGMGVVYLASDDGLGRPVALKTLPRILPEGVERLRREARAVASVSHPAVATIYGVESWRAAPVLVFEYLGGGTLEDRLRRGPMAEAEVVAVARQVLAGLGRLHGSGLLHRDLKPGNVGFTADGAVKVLDFGLSRLVGAPLHVSGGDAPAAHAGRHVGEPGASVLAGTPLYMSPEALAGRPPDAAQDLWALAMLMLAALAGGHPWAGLDFDTVLVRLEAGDVPDPARLAPGCSTALRDLLRRALSPDPAARPRSAADLDCELAHLSEWGDGPRKHGGEHDGTA